MPHLISHIFLVQNSTKISSNKGADYFMYLYCYVWDYIYLSFLTSLDEVFYFPGQSTSSQTTVLLIVINWKSYYKRKTHW